MCDYRNGSNAGTAPWLMSVNMWPADTTLMPRRSTPRATVPVRMATDSVATTTNIKVLASDDGNGQRTFVANFARAYGVVTQGQLPAYVDAIRVLASPRGGDRGSDLLPDRRDRDRV